MPPAPPRPAPYTSPSRPRPPGSGQAPGSAPPSAAGPSPCTSLAPVQDLRESSPKDRGVPGGAKEGAEPEVPGGGGFATPELGGDELLGSQRHLKYGGKVSRTGEAPRNGGGVAKLEGIPISHSTSLAGSSQEFCQLGEWVRSDPFQRSYGVVNSSFQDGYTQSFAPTPTPPPTHYSVASGSAVGLQLGSKKSLVR